MKLFNTYSLKKVIRHGLFQQKLNRAVPAQECDATMLLTLTSPITNFSPEK